MRKKAFRSLEAYNQIWIITERDRTINCADCLGCNAGLTESCLLIASVLFYLEAWTMQPKCPLVLPSSANKVEYSRVRDINFKSAKKMKADLDETIENLNEGLQVSENSEVFSGSCVQKPEVPAPTQVEMESLTSANAKQSLCCWAWCPLLIRHRRKCRSFTFTPGSSIICFLDSISSRSCLSRSPATRFSSRPLALSSRLAATSR